MALAKATALSAVNPAKQYDFGAEQGIQAFEHVRELCPFSPHAEQVLRCFLTVTTLDSLKMFMQPARPSSDLLTFLVLTILGSLKMFMQPARPSSDLLTFLVLTGASVALSCATARFSAAGATRNWHVRLL